MIKLENVNKYFNKGKKNELHIINNASLEFENQGLVAILGHSGSGKTTLLNAIGGLDKVNKGKIYINGERITKKSANKIDKVRNLNIGYIFQDYKLIENMSVFDNIAISLKMIGLKNKEEIEKRVNYVLEAVSMYRYRNRPARMLSGGEKQRVAIARALVKNPSIVIADEPTGNLDSKNSLEIMNIIKAISKEKLVILVTHEIDLANFYASRIIKFQDGKIIEDYKNSPKESLEYRLDNKLYLKDFESIKSIKNDNLDVEVYSDNKSDGIKLKLVIKDGNIYIQTENHKVEVVDENSAIELVDDHYKKIDKSIYDDSQYNLDKVIDKKYKVKYSSIHSTFKSIINGFKKILNYSILKKILLFGFFLSSMFVVYSVTRIAGILDLKDTDFMRVDRNYVSVEIPVANVDNFLNYEKIGNIDYILPGNSQVSFFIQSKSYYQISRRKYSFSGSLVSLDAINDTNLVKGRMPQNDYEIVIDKLIVNQIINGRSNIGKSIGITNEDELLGKIVTMEGMKDFKIVGFADTKAASIFANKKMFVNLINYSNNNSNNYYTNRYDYMYGENNKIKDYELYLDEIKLTSGRMPQNDYEVIVNHTYGGYELNKSSNIKVNGKELLVVGFYDSINEIQSYLVNNNTVKYKLIETSNEIMVYTNNKHDVINTLRNEYGLNAIDRYQEDKENYLKQKDASIKSSIMSSAVVLLISLIEIYLMMRSSFLSRIKEVGVYRAIGMKKLDIYKMFSGEIIAITTCGSLPGIIIMTYILGSLSKISFVSRMFMVNFWTIGVSILFIYAFNLLVGLIPLYRVIKKAPARILARYDVE